MRQRICYQRSRQTSAHLCSLTQCATPHVASIVISSTHRDGFCTQGGKAATAFSIMMLSRCQPGCTVRLVTNCGWCMPGRPIACPRNAVRLRCQASRRERAEPAAAVPQPSSAESCSDSSSDDDKGAGVDFDRTRQALRKRQMQRLSNPITAVVDILDFLGWELARDWVLGALVAAYFLSVVRALM